MARSTLASSWILTPASMLIPLHHICYVTSMAFVEEGKCPDSIFWFVVDYTMSTLHFCIFMCTHLTTYSRPYVWTYLTTQNIKRLAHNTPCFFSLTSAGELNFEPLSITGSQQNDRAGLDTASNLHLISPGNWAVSAELAHTEKHFYLFMTEINLWLGGPCEKQLWKHIDTETHLLRVMATFPAAASALYSLPVLCGNTSNNTNSLLSDVSFTPLGEVSH